MGFRPSTAKLLRGRAFSTVRRKSRNSCAPSSSYQPFDAHSKVLGRRPRPKPYKYANGEAREDMTQAQVTQLGVVGDQ